MAVRPVAIALALAATLLTQKAVAQSVTPHDTSSSTPEDATPLALRAGKPLELSPPAQPAGFGWKVVAVLSVLGAAAFYLRKRAAPKRRQGGELTIVHRTTIGFRSELLVVNVEGQRLLIGVTPHSIQSLSMLDTEGAAAPAEVEQASAEPVGSGDRFAAMLKAAEPRESPRSPESQRTDLPDAARDVALAGQARGLAGLRRRG